MVFYNQIILSQSRFKCMQKCALNAAKQLSKYRSFKKAAYSQIMASYVGVQHIPSCKIVYGYVAKQGQNIIYNQDVPHKGFAEQNATFYRQTQNLDHSNTKEQEFFFVIKLSTFFLVLFYTLASRQFISSISFSFENHIQKYFAQDTFTILFLI